MRPPICVICHKRYGPGEGIGIHFALSEEDIKNNKRFEKPGFVGHPAGFEWFCNQHAIVAKKYNHLCFKEAIALIREESNK